MLITENYRIVRKVCNYYDALLLGEMHSTAAIIPINNALHSYGKADLLLCRVVGTVVQFVLYDYSHY